MNFEQEMGKFFRNYSATDRNLVELSEEYQKAVEIEDVVKAQEIACGVLEGSGKTKKKAIEDRADKRIDRTFGQF